MRRVSEFVLVFVAALAAATPAYGEAPPDKGADGAKKAQQPTAQQPAGPAAQHPDEPGSYDGPAPMPVPHRDPPAAATAATKPTPASERLLTGIATPKNPTGKSRAATTAWKELWSVPIGATPLDKGSHDHSQIAARGGLVVAASAGVRGQVDAADGVYVIDGRDDAVRDGKQRLVRRIPSPSHGKPTGDTSEPTDAIGAALDGDDVVFATAAGAVRKARLDGLVLWDAWSLPAGTRPGLPALIDIDADGIADVIVPLVVRPPCPDTPCRIALLLDGKDGHVLGTFDEPSAGFQKNNDASPCDPSDLRLQSFQAASNPKQAALWLRCSQGTSQFVLSATSHANYPDSAPRLDWTLLPGVSADDLADPPHHTYFIVPSAGSLHVVTDESPSYQSIGWSANKALESDPTIADVNLDGSWDALVVADGALHAISTETRGRLHQGYPRGDPAATGVEPAEDDTPEAYRSRARQRDVTRWLRRDLEPSDSSFELADAQATGSASFVPEPPELKAADPKQPAPVAQVSCHRQYALVEGDLVVRQDGAWAKVPGAPWPVVGLLCAGDALVMKRADGTRYQLLLPPAWKSWAGLLFGVLPLVILGVGWWRRRRLAGGRVELSRPIVLTDTPRKRLKGAHKDQRNLVEGLRNVLDNEGTRAPVAVALFGAWGSGKSSVMRMLQEELKKTGRYIDVWFNAWRYHNEDQITPALLQTIADAVRDQTDWTTRLYVIWDRFRKARTRDILIVVGVSVLGTYALLVCFRIATSSMPSAATTSTGLLGSLGSFFFVLATLWHRLWTPLTKVVSIDPAKLLASEDSSQRIQGVREVAKEFEQVSSRLPMDTRLIVYLDDLDRCRPDRIVSALETISMLADTGCAFFVVAFDPAVVRRSVELVYKDVIELARQEDPDEARTFGHRFIEKMFTLGVHVPPIPPGDVNVAPPHEDDEDEPSSALERAASVLLPSRSWLLAIVLAAIPIAIGSYFVHRNGGISSFVDVSARVVSGTFLASSAGVPSASAPAPTVSATPATPAAGASTAPEPADTKPPSLASEAALVPPTARQVAEPEPEAQPPALVSALARYAPSTERTFGEVMRVLVAGFAVLAAMVTIALLLADAVRRSRIRSAPPMSKDTEAFKAALDAAKARLPANPRSVVRFTNFSRFLYGILAERDTSPEWDKDFFDVVGAWWRGARVPTAHDSDLRRALEAWLPAPDSVETDRPSPRESGTNELASAGENGGVDVKSG